jgi:hypothetical protein
MVIVAGPPGAGKSSVFPLTDFADQVFNADDRAAALNGGSYESIPLAIRTAVNRAVEQLPNVASGSGLDRMPGYNGVGQQTCDRQCRSPESNHGGFLPCFAMYLRRVRG